MDLMTIVKRKDVEENFRKRRRVDIDPLVSQYSNDAIISCSISSSNILAFSSYGNLKSNCSKKVVNQNAVYVCDINTPWDIFQVKSSTTDITVLEWDPSGKYLLICDRAGNAEMWAMLTHLLNEWTRVAHICIPDEPIKAGIFFNNAKKIMVNNQNRDNLGYWEKYIHSEMIPTVQGFGGCPLEGFLVVGMTGLVQAFAMGGTKGKATNIEVLGGMRVAYQYVDLAWTRAGEILVTACTGNPQDPIMYCKLLVEKEDSLEFSCLLDEYRLRIEMLTSFFLQQSSSEDVRIAGLNFSTKQDPGGVFLLLNLLNRGSLQYWMLCEQERPFHSLFGPTSETTRVLQWQCISVFNSNSNINLFSPTTNVWVTAPDTGLPCHHIIIATSTGELICLHRENLQQIGQLNIFDKVKYDSIPTKSVISMCFTATGNAAVIFDFKSTMFICKLSPLTDPGGPMTIPYALMALEYCLVSGVDYWDILIGLRPAMLDAVCDRLTDNFNQQSPATQQFFQYKLLTLKMAIYRLVPNGNAKAGSQYITLVLNSIYSALRALLRPPPELFNQDRAPADSLSAVLSSKALEGITEVDKVLLHLEAKEFTVEASALITVQHLIQWTTTLALKLLSSLPESRNSPRGNLCDVLRDTKVLNMLRELLVIFRIWGLIRQTCLPAFCYMENIDVIATLFRILTRLLQSPEPDDSLLDECCQLSCQLVIPDIGLSLPARGLASSILFFNQWPLQCHYGTYPEEPSPTKFDMSMTCYTGSETELKIDSIRHVYLGNTPPNVKYCTRCKGVSIVKGLARSAAAKSWDMRWQMTCPCRGIWVKQEAD